MESQSYAVPHMTEKLKRTLIDVIRRERERGDSWDAIAERLACFEVSKRTLQRWVDDENGPDIPVKPVSNVRGFTGPRGSGKSLVVAQDGSEYLELGWRVFYWPEEYKLVGGEYRSIQQLIDMGDDLRHALLIIDEAHLAFPAIRSTSTAAFALGKLTSQIRKRGLDLDWTSNSVSSVAATLQNQTDFHARCKAYVPPDFPGMDEVWVSWKDTQGRFGKGPVVAGGRHGKPDTRLTFVETLYPASAVYPLFDTDGAAGLDILDITADSLRERRAREDNPVLRKYLRHVFIPWAIEGNFKKLDPEGIAESLTMDTTEGSGWDGGAVTTEDVATALKALALRKAGNGFALPKNAAAFVSGLQ